MLPDPLQTLPKPLRVFLWVLLPLALFSLADGALGYHLLGRSGLRYLWPDQPAVDFYVYNQRVTHLHSPEFFRGPYFPWMYPAPSIFAYVPFYPGIRDTHWWPNYLAFLIVVGGFDLGMARYLFVALRERGLAARPAAKLLAAVMALGWPFYFAFERGNIELLLWIGVAGGVFCFAQQRFLPAALLLGIFGSAKLYPLLLLGLFLQKGRLRYMATGVLAAAATTLLALRYLEPDVVDAYRRISAGVRLWTALTALQSWPTGVGPDHSLFGLLREVSQGAIVRNPRWLSLYLVLAGTVALAAFLLRVRRLPDVNQILFLICAAILLPPTSFDYTLLQLLTAWAWVVLLCVERARAGEDLGQFVPLMALFGVSLAPLTFLHTYAAVQFLFAGPVRCVALVGLAVLAAWRPLTGASSERDRMQAATA